MNDGCYDIAEVCVNGHTTNSMSARSPQRNKKFCDKCGQRTITACESCGEHIRGIYHRRWGGIGGYDPPAFCHECGQAYPWTEAALTAARELADELENLSEEEKNTLKGSIEDIVRDTPRASVAASKFRRLATKAGKGVGQAFRSIFVDIASETAKKMLRE